MTDELKKVYAKENKLDRYFDTATPCHLFRGISKGSKVLLMQPTLIGFYKWKPDPTDPKKKVRDLTVPRHPDVLVTGSTTGKTPQYEGGTTEGLLREEDRKKMEITLEILKNAGDYMVYGCRTTNVNGHHRGLSLFNGVNSKLPFNWFLIKAGTPIPPGLAVTRDADVTKKDIVHYTVAPKDDMTLSLFLEQLADLGKDATAAD